MTTDSDSCHVDYLYENRHLWLPCGLFFNRKVLYHCSLSKVIPQKTKFNIEYLKYYSILIMIQLSTITNYANRIENGQQSCWELPQQCWGQAEILMGICNTIVGTVLEYMLGKQSNGKVIHHQTKMANLRLNQPSGSNSVKINSPIDIMKKQTDTQVSYHKGLPPQCRTQIWGKRQYQSQLQVGGIDR